MKQFKNILAKIVATAVIFSYYLATLMIFILFVLAAYYQSVQELQCTIPELFVSLLTIWCVHLLYTDDPTDREILGLPVGLNISITIAAIILFLVDLYGSDTINTRALFFCFWSAPAMLAIWGCKEFLLNNKESETQKIQS